MATMYMQIKNLSICLSIYQHVTKQITRYSGVITQYMPQDWFKKRRGLVSFRLQRQGGRCRKNRFARSITNKQELLGKICIRGTIKLSEKVWFVGVYKKNESAVMCARTALKGGCYLNVDNLPDPGTTQTCQILSPRESSLRQTPCETIDRCKL